MNVEYVILTDRFAEGMAWWNDEIGWTDSEGDATRFSYRDACRIVDSEGGSLMEANHD